MKKQILPLIIMSVASTLFAAAPENPVKTISTTEEISEGTYTIATGESWLIESGGILKLPSYNKTAEFNIHGTLYSESSTEFLVLNNGGNSNITMNIDGGNILYGHQNGASINFGKDGGSGLATVNLKNGASISSEAGGLSYEIGRNNKAVMSIDATSSITGQNFSLATRKSANSAAELTVKGSLTSTGEFNIGQGGTATVTIDGGTATLKRVRIAANNDNLKGSEWAKDKLIIKKGSTVTISERLEMGANHTSSAYSAPYLKVYDNVSNIESLLEMHTGATVSLTNDTAYIGESATIKFVLDSSTFAGDTSTPVFTVKDMYIYTNTTDATHDSILIDGERLTSKVAGLVEGDIVSVALMKFVAIEGNIKINDTRYTFSQFEEQFTNLISFANNTNSKVFEGFDYSNLEFKDNTMFLNLTYVPEPSTYAAIFGALVLAFVAYRRRK